MPDLFNRSLEGKAPLHGIRPVFCYPMDMSSMFSTTGVGGGCYQQEHFCSVGSTCTKANMLDLEVMVFLFPFFNFSSALQY